MNIKEIVNGKEYDFLRNNKYLENIIFLCLGGSHAYGLNTPNSDIDIRGVCFPPYDNLTGCGFLHDKAEPYVIFGENGFEQITETNTDTTIYSIHKLFKLLYNCNPNTIEMLGCRKQDYLMYSPIAEYLIRNADVFLSKMAYRSFAEYARGQFQRLKNALGRQRQGTLSNVLCMADAVNRMQKHLEREYSNYNTKMVSIEVKDKEGNDVYIDGHKVVPDDIQLLFYDTYKEVKANGKTIDPDDVELVFNVNIDMLPARQFTSVMNEIGSNIKEFNKVLGHRNNKKDDYHLCKHSQHLFRLYMMGYDILHDGVIQTYREKEHDFLMEVKNGKFFNGESFSKEFFDMVTEYDQRLEQAYKTSYLPETPDKDRIRRLAKDITDFYFWR